MAAGVPARLTAAEGRKFAFPVGGAFALLTAVALWRSRHATAAVLGTLAAALLVAGLVAPTALGPVQRGWMRLAHAISRVTTPIMLGVVYFLVFTPVAIVMRLAGRDALGLSAVPRSTWVPRPAGQQRSDLTRQF